MKRAEILREAAKCVCGGREQDYGTPENNFEAIACYWSEYLKKATGVSEKIRLTAKDVAAMMALLKIARISTSNKADSFIDLAGYAACAGEIATEENEAKAENRCENCNYDYVADCDFPCSDCRDFENFSSKVS